MITKRTNPFEDFMQSLAAKNCTPQNIDRVKSLELLVELHQCFRELEECKLIAGIIEVSFAEEDDDGTHSTSTRDMEERNDQHVQLIFKDIEQLLANIDKLPEKLRALLQQYYQLKTTHCEQPSHVEPASFLDNQTNKSNQAKKV